GAARSIANAVVVNGNFGIAGANGVTLTGAMDLGASPRVISVNGADATFSGAIIGAAGTALIKEGAGRLILSGSNSDNGATVVNSGTLNFAATQTLRGPLTIAATGRVDVTGGGGANVLVTPAVSVDAANAATLDLT